MDLDTCKQTTEIYLGGTLNLLQEFTIQAISMRKRKVKCMCVFRRVDASLNRSCAEAQVCLLKLFPEPQLLHCSFYQQSDTPTLPEETGRPQAFLVASFSCLAWNSGTCSDSSPHRPANSFCALRKETIRTLNAGAVASKRNGHTLGSAPAQ